MDGYGLNYRLPMLKVCSKTLYKNGSWVQTIPKLIPGYAVKNIQCRRQSKLGIPPGQRVCRLPDCLEDPCLNSWCEETMTGYHCHDMKGFSEEPGDERHVTTTLATHAINIVTNTTTQITTSVTTSVTPSTIETDPAATAKSMGRCPNDWLEGANNKCYYMYVGTDHDWWIDWYFTWYEARNACAEINVTAPNGSVVHTQLLVLESEEEMLEMKQILIDSFESWYPRYHWSFWPDLPDRIWLNCNDVVEEGTFYCNTNGESVPMKYTNWEINQPSENVTSDYSEDCVSTWTYWPFIWTIDDVSCDDYAGAICEMTQFQEDTTSATLSSFKPSKSSLSPSTTNAETCPDDWFEGENKCYYVDTNMPWHTWYEARNACAEIKVNSSNGEMIPAQLLVLESEDEMLELKQIVIDSFEHWYFYWYSIHRFWLNCNDMRQEGTFYCDKNGESIVMQYSNWETGKPDDNVNSNTTEDCVSTTGYWPFIWTFDDFSCDDWEGTITICEVIKF